MGFRLVIQFTRDHYQAIPDVFPNKATAYEYLKHLGYDYIDYEIVSESEYNRVMGIKKPYIMHTIRAPKKFDHHIPIFKPKFVHRRED